MCNLDQELLAYIRETMEVMKEMDLADVREMENSTAELCTK